MEYIDGPNLETWLTSEVHDLSTREDVFRQIVAAVRAAHAKNLVHRDLKPMNILMARLGDSWTPKVCDFGIAKITAEEADPTTGATQTGITMGTPAFMAPEQIRDAKNVDHRADIFSLGCILYQLMTGVQPFRTPDIVDLYNAITQGIYTDPRAHTPELSDPIVHTIRRCLEVDRDHRMPDCDAILGSLDQDFVAPPAPRSPPSRRPWILVGLVGLTTAAFLGASTLGLIGLLSSTHTPFTSPAQDGGCVGKPGVVIGYLKAPKIFLKRRGQTWTLPRDLEVVKQTPTEENEFTTGETALCTLPRGTRVELRHDLIKTRGSWIAVEADALTRPAPPDPDAPESE
jgi:serine/threonine-protein kinase